jgi:hypothetical protein
MKLPPILQGDSLTRLLQGAAAGCAITLILGFGWGGWQLESKAQKTAEQSAIRAVVAVLAPICVDRFQRATDSKASLIALKATDSWKQDTFVEKGGWATFSGSEPNRSVAEACAKLLSDLK